MTDLTRARQIALQILYQLDVTGEEPGPVQRTYADRAAPRPAVAERAWGLVLACHARRQELDRIIAGHARNWTIDRMAPVDRNVLRLGAYELLYADDIPPKVAINEAVELAKRFGHVESGAFVNAILDAIRKDHA